MKIFCRVCKEHIEVKSSKEFKEGGHFPNDEKSHLLEPNLGRSSRRHSKAARRDADLQRAVAEAKQKAKEKEAAV